MLCNIHFFSPDECGHGGDDDEEDDDSDELVSGPTVRRF